MASRKKNVRSTRSATAGSWLALLAATTVGDGADTLRAEVHADVSEGDYRLVVQSYDATDGSVPGLEVRPVGSLQRAVTAHELREGVRVHLLELRGPQAVAVRERPLVVAWIEAGAPDLEFDGRTARPMAGSVYGLVPRDVRAEGVRISLNRVA